MDETAHWDPAGPGASNSSIDRVCDAFEAAWKAGRAPDMELFAAAGWPPSLGQPPRELFLELVLIDLAYRWSPRTGNTVTLDTTVRHQALEGSPPQSPLPPRPLLDDYCRRYPALGAVQSLPERAVVSEYSARCMSGAPPTHGEYLRRFPHYAASLPTMLAQADRELPTRRQAAPAMRQLGKFELIEPVGEGGFGTVYQARDRQLDRIVAIKLPRYGTFAGPAERERFFREARSAARLNHPGICPIYEAGEEDGQTYLAMGFVEGETLNAWAASRRVTLREAAELVARLARAVHYAHQHGVVHRDIKPANVMIDRTSGDPVLMDFGLAKDLGEKSIQLTQTGDVMGTPAYMAPEQASGRLDRIGPATDIYALGVMLYELLAGRLPFTGAVGEVLVKVQSEEPLSLSKAAPGVHPDLRTVCHKAMAKEPAERYPTAEALADDLGRFAAGEPILARREGVLRKLVRRVRRNPVWFATVAVTLASVLLGIVMVVRDVRERRVSTLLTTIEAGLEAGQWEPGPLDRLEATIDDLQRLSPERAEELRRRLGQRFSESVARSLGSPRLLPDDFTRIERQIDRLASRDRAAAESLRDQLARRKSDWEPLFELASPYNALEATFDPDQVVAGQRGLVPAASAPTPLVVLTRRSCEGSVQWEAEFEPSWTSAASLGLLLGVTETGGYRFTLECSAKRETEAALSMQAAPSMQAALDLGEPLILAISRQDIRLRQREVQPSELVAKGLRLRVQRLGSELSVWLNEGPPLEFEDIFPASPSQRGVFGLLWPAGVGVRRVSAARQPLQVQASPLEKGDDLFNRGQVAEALAFYQEAKRTCVSPFREEAQYKEGVSLIHLGRDEEACAALTPLLAAQGDRWPLLAGCQLWIVQLKRKQLDEADVVFTNLASRFRFEDFGGLVPWETRNQILRAYTPPRIRFFVDAPGLLAELQRLHAVEQFWMAEAAGSATSLALLRVHWARNEIDKALEVAERSLFAEPRGSSPPRSFTNLLDEYCWMLRLHRSPKQALDVLDRAVAGKLAMPPYLAMHMRVERARAYYAMGQPGQALRDLETYVAEVNLASTDGFRFIDAYLMLGLLRRAQGDEAGAQEAWRTGLSRARPAPGNPLGHAASLQRNIRGGTRLIHYLATASLANDLLQQDSDACMNSLLGSLGEASATAGFLGNPLLRTQVFPEKVVREILERMWRTPRGLQCATQVAFRQVAFHELPKLPLQLTAMEYLQSHAFGGELDADREAIIAGLLDQMIDQYVKGQLSSTDIVALALTWKGQTGALGWTGVARRFESTPALRASLAYLFAHRYRVLKQEQDVRAFLELAAKDAPADSVLHRVTRKELQPR